MSGSAGLRTNTAPSASKVRWPSASCAWSTAMAARASPVTSRAAEKTECLIVQESVCGKNGARVDVGLALEVRETAARLLHEDLHGGGVPGLEIALGVDLALARGDQAVAVVVAEAALPRGRVDQAHEAIPVADVLEEIEARMQQHGVFHGRAGGDVDALAVGPGTLALARPEELARDGIVHHARGDLAVLLEGDEHGPDGNVAHEVLGPVDGIDDPAPRGRTFCAELLAEEAAARRGAGQGCANGLLRFLIGLGHRSLVGLDGDLEAAMIVAHGDLPRGARGLEARGDGGMHHGHSPRSSSTCL